VIAGFWGSLFSFTGGVMIGVSATIALTIAGFAMAHAAGWSRRPVQQRILVPIDVDLTDDQIAFGYRHMDCVECAEIDK